MTASSNKPLVLVTGASGYIASHCVKEMLENGYRVRGTVRSLGDKRKVAHLQAMTDGASLELVEADLTREEGWADAVEGCEYVLHVASPFPATVPEDENELIGPAVEGTRRVLAAAAATGTVRRVVLTSSVAAIAFGHEDDAGKVYTEEDWSDVERCDPYPKSKTLAERAAWDFVDAMPRHETGKLHKRILRDPYWKDAGRQI